MFIMLSPQRNDTNRIEYTFNGDTITATFKEVTDVFDFTGFPDGSVSGTDIDTELAVNPILEAKRENGVLYVTLLNYINEQATEEERFPQWKEV